MIKIVASASFWLAWSIAWLSPTSAFAGPLDVFNDLSVFSAEPNELDEGFLFPSGTQQCTTIIAKDRVVLEYRPRKLLAYEFSAAEQRWLWAKSKVGFSKDLSCPATVVMDEVIARLKASVEVVSLKLQEQSGVYIEASATPDHWAQKDRLCLLFDRKSESYVGVQTGKRDAYLRCVEKVGLCERYAKVRGKALSGVGTAIGAAGGAALGTSAAGITAVAHSSGAVILTGSGGYIAGTLGTVGAVGLGVLTAPAILGGITLSGVTVGAFELVCPAREETEQAP